MTWRIGLLFLGAALLLVASVAIVSGALRGRSSPPVPASATIPAVTAPPLTTATRAVATTSSATTTRPRTTPTTTTRTAALASPQAQRTVPRATATTSALPTVVNGGCAMSLPGGYGADPRQIGYYPARDRTGFVALDSFDGAGQTPATLAQTFVRTTLSRVLTDYQQTGATDLGDRYRIDYRATANGQAGRGSIQVQVFGGGGCGVTLFTLDGSAASLADTFDLLVRSLSPLQSPRVGTPITTP